MLPCGGDELHYVGLERLRPPASAFVGGENKETPERLSGVGMGRELGIRGWGRAG